METKDGLVMAMVIYLLCGQEILKTNKYKDLSYQIKVKVWLLYQSSINYRWEWCKIVKYNLKMFKLICKHKS